MESFFGDLLLKPRKGKKSRLSIDTYRNIFNASKWLYRLDIEMLQNYRISNR